MFKAANSDTQTETIEVLIWKLLAFINDQQQDGPIKPEKKAIISGKTTYNSLGET